ncbi:Uncharacterized membrane protein [Granulicella rosea]|uniref:Uncharacterized membrane protein n=1 Tax=Granulicella rosea TaxID=474952 RepID=A0A239D7I5_9BACT|nr:heparan-alpha-glucosaminide N-acetyltransferase domain-containing protein [Granulicella rosea]SNS27834.1 Uncharacterized membrane protein [Granulicella rosea]
MATIASSHARDDSNAASELFPVPLEPRRRRLESIDILRGLLMLLMALDHTRDYFTYLTINPVDPHASWPALFATRWVTHLCAPGFISLAGASVYLQRMRGKTSAQLARLLITRGLWLMFMEITVVSFGWSFCWAPFLQVIWAVGVAMVGLGLIVRLPVWAIGGIGVAIGLLHNLLDPIQARSFGPYANLWRLVQEPGPLTFHGHIFVLCYYPSLAWFGVICLGYAFGTVAHSAPARRQRIAATLSVCFAATFTLLRLFHGYGDPFRFERLDTPARTAMSFLSVMKYPPSLHYELATFSVLLALYTLFDYASEHDWLPRMRRFFETFGRVPFFYYVPHIYLLHTLAILGTLAAHRDWHFWFTPAFQWEDAIPAGWGYGLPVVYAVWLLAVAILYKPCVWFSGVKARRRDWWLSYL